MVQDGLIKDPEFKQLAFLWQRTLEKPWSCCCCRPKAEKAARRLRVALRRVVTCGGKLPPIGPPLIIGDNEPREAHTPTYRRDVAEQMHLLQDPGFRHSALAIDLAKNIVKAAKEEEEQALARGPTHTIRASADPPGDSQAGNRPEASSSVGGETISARRTGVLSTLGGDIDLVVDERTSQPTVPPTLAWKDVIQRWLEKEEHLARPFEPGPGPLTSDTSGGSSPPRRARPRSTEAGRALGTGPPTASLVPEIEAIPDTPGPSAATEASSATLAMGRTPAQLPSLRIRPQAQVERDRPPSGCALTTPAAESSQIARPGTFTTSEIQPLPPASTSGHVASRAASVVGSLASAATPRSARVTAVIPSRSATSASTRPRSPAKQQNFGNSNRERRRLIAAAYGNIKINEVDLPVGVSWPRSRDRTTEGSSRSGSSDGGDSPRPGRSAEAEGTAASGDGSQRSGRPTEGATRGLGGGDSPRTVRSLETVYLTPRGDESGRSEWSTETLARVSVAALKQEKEEATWERG